jgi:hypothetical protein
MRDAPLAGLYVLFYEQAKTYLGSKSTEVMLQDHRGVDLHMNAMCKIEK